VTAVRFRPAVAAVQEWLDRCLALDEKGFIKTGPDLPLFDPEQPASWTSALRTRRIALGFLPIAAIMLGFGEA